MANRLDKKDVGRISELASRGLSMREVARQLGISPVTCMKYYKPGTCKCGRPANHNGWCKWRYTASMLRQAFQAKRRGITLVVPGEVRHSQKTSRRMRRCRWFSLSYGPPVVYDWLGAWAMADRHVRSARVNPEHRTDLIHDITLGIVDGRIYLDEIDDAVRAFHSKYYQDVFHRDVEFDSYRGLRSDFDHWRMNAYINPGA